MPFAAFASRISAIFLTNVYSCFKMTFHFHPFFFLRRKKSKDAKLEEKVKSLEKASEHEEKKEKEEEKKKKEEERKRKKAEETKKKSDKRAARQRENQMFQKAKAAANASFEAQKEIFEQREKRSEQRIKKAEQQIELSNRKLATLADTNKADEQQLLHLEKRMYPRALIRQSLSSHALNTRPTQHTYHAQHTSLPRYLPRNSTSAEATRLRLGEEAAAPPDRPLSAVPSALHHAPLPGPHPLLGAAEQRQFTRVTPPAPPLAAAPPAPLFPSSSGRPLPPAHLRVAASPEPLYSSAAATAALVTPVIKMPAPAIFFPPHNVAQPSSLIQSRSTST